MKRLVFVFASVLFAVSAFAQTGTPTSWNLRLYTAGGAQLNAISVTTAQASCNQPVPTASGINPTKWWWGDPVNSGRACLYDDATRLLALADGNYEGAAQAVNADGSSAETARVPFTRRRPNPPAVPTGGLFTQ
jgi:hypothetical protein